MRRYKYSTALGIQRVQYKPAMAFFSASLREVTDAAILEDATIVFEAVVASEKDEDRDDDDDDDVEEKVAETEEKTLETEV